jgi:exopolysaccharide production protein ExoQ
MPPTLALFLWLILLLALLCFDPAKNPEVSPALWIPVTWLFILASRLPSQWFGVQSASAAQAYQDGNSLDRTILSLLILLALGKLMSRSFKWGNFLASNRALVALLLFALVSVFWSDFPLISLKRWFRDLGSYIMILVVLSDSHPREAIRTVFRRLCYLVIPLSILLVKYYPEIGKQYDEWSGTSLYSGAATSKNMLGVACLVSGMVFFWDTVTRWSDRRERRTKRVILVNFAFMAMTLWLLNLSDSSTSSVCLIIGCAVIAALHGKWGRRHSTFIKALAPGSFCLYLILVFIFNVNGDLAYAVGRQSNLTGRTILWQILLHMHTNPLVGVGYDSFWLGPRLQHVWDLFGLTVNEAHNGYLEIYLELGLIGLFLLVGFLISSYGTICKRIESSPAIASLGLATWTVLLFYNVTEAAFKGGLLWMVLLASATVVPERFAKDTRVAKVFENSVRSVRSRTAAVGPTILRR